MGVQNCIMMNKVYLLISALVFLDPVYAAFLHSPYLGLQVPTSGDIIENTRAQADILKTTLRSLSRQSNAAPILEKIFAKNSNDCINNMDQAIDAIETSTSLFENAGTAIKLLLQNVRELQTIKDTPKAVRQTAKIISLLGALIPQLTPSSSSCQASSKDVFGSMQSLQALVDELSTSTEFQTTTHGRQTLKTSAVILSKVINFLKKESHFKFDKFCTKGKEYNKDFFTAIAKMISDLADLYTTLGGLTSAKDIKNQEQFTISVVAKIDKLGALNLVGLECTTSGTFDSVATTLEEIAGLIEDVGIESLCKQLGLDSNDCSF